MRTRILLAAAGAVALCGAAHAKCYELADVDSFGPQTKIILCDDQPTGIQLNLERMREAPESIKGYRVAGPAAEIRLPDESIEANAVEAWAEDRATNGGFILQIEDYSQAQKVARTINAGAPLEIVLTDADGTEFSAFSGTFDMRFPKEMLD